MIIGIEKTSSLTNISSKTKRILEIEKQNHTSLTKSYRTHLKMKLTSLEIRTECHDVSLD